MDDQTQKNCKICEKAWPLANHFIGALGLTDAYLFEDQFFPGWTVLVLKEHQTELFQLTQGERGQLMEEVSLVGENLTQVYSVRKINSELLGNQVPHIHWHVVPRLIADPAPLKPVWSVSHEPVRLTDKDLAERLRLLRGALRIS
ncbi:HIT family protein [Candidatus Nitronereus thalassa]|uniref:HIT family protein n=1 Tax=Candidatus Nitronereus thalassa TaxID=3020898 RepID=A0ABU3KAS0_9BACT|nr:HIT family protein [Candidatus Nitronereus thalassa]MDT7043574.1 HIT family protein [Candidatus Nitronereus thalassa]